MTTSHELKNAKRLLSGYNDLIKIALVNDAGALGLADTIPFCCPPLCRELARKYAKDEVMHINRAFTAIPPLEHCLLRLLFIENVSARVVAMMLRWKIKRVKKYEAKALADFIEAYRALPKNADERVGDYAKIFG